ALAASGLSFAPDHFAVRAGAPVSAELHVGDSLYAGVTHGLVFELEHGLTAEAPPADSGMTTGVRFTAPSAPGSYTYYCPVGIHRALGMEGTMDVTADGLPSAT